MRHLSVAVERFPLAAPFVIARGTRTESVVVVATLRQGGNAGRGECVPYARYGETPTSVAAQIEAARAAIEAGGDRTVLGETLPPGAARNALDCALWDLDSKRLGVPAHQLAGAHRIAPATTAFTISLGAPDTMGRAAAAQAWRPLLKLKLGGAEDAACLAAVREGAPESELIADANEAWRAHDLETKLDACRRVGVALVEQPLPADGDDLLAHVGHPVPICADESLHHRGNLAALRPRYDAINIKLDKTGGLTEALALAQEAERLGFTIMVGCMVATSLAMAPAMLLTPKARFVDLDGPLLLAHDREHGLRYEGSIVHPPMPQLWG